MSSPLFPQFYVSQSKHVNAIQVWTAIYFPDSMCEMPRITIQYF